MALFRTNTDYAYNMSPDKSTMVLDDFIPEEVDFSADELLRLLRQKQHQGLLGTTEIGKNVPACLVGVLQGFTEEIVGNAIACAVEAKSPSVGLRHLQVVILADPVLRDFVYHNRHLI